jgi:hypothetical protein
MRYSIKEAIGAGPIMLGDIADDLDGIRRKFAQYFPMIEQQFENPYVTSNLNNILRNLAVIVRECRAGTASLERGGQTANMFIETFNSVNELANYIQQEEPNMIVLVQIFSETMLTLQEIANAISSRVGIAKTKAAGVVDYVMFSDLVDLLDQLGSHIENDPNYSGYSYIRRFGEFRRVANSLSSLAQRGMTVQEADRLLKRVAQMIMAFEPLEPYGEGLKAGINQQIMTIIQDLQLPEEEMHRATFPNLPRVRSLATPVDDDDYNE